LLVTLGVTWLGVACGARTSLDGELEGVGGFTTAGSAATGSAGTGTAGAATLDALCRTPCSDQIFEAASSCKLCHAAAIKLGGLDLESPSRAARLKDAPAKHLDSARPDAQCPVGDKLIDSSNVENSWLLKKITGRQGTCGDAMPLGVPLNEAERQCLTAWVRCVAGS
jgi:hypothetical protein